MDFSRRSFLSKSGIIGSALVAAPFASVQAVQAAQGKVAASAHFTVFQVGKFKLVALLDGQLQLPSNIVTGYDEKKAQAAHSAIYRPYTQNQLTGTVNGYLIDDGNKVYLVDTGAADLLGPSLGAFPISLKAAGYKAEDVDAVIITHLHGDHIGGLTDAAGKAAFPNAELIYHEAEANFWLSESMRSNAPKEIQVYFDLAKAKTSAYGSRQTLVQGNNEIASGISTVFLPGHTPGHMGIRLESEGQTVLIWGDIIHMAAVQFAHPEWTISFDTDQELAASSRKKILDQVATDEIPVIGMHHDFPGFGRVLRKGSSYEYLQVSSVAG
ncbi:MBL fold metallo-hydrolase [Flexibacterium corallicola]|uniref:MBL fold metallo-hydrolase n=1 Tax=Flexibacterium corallicola TaxID=3037259 RepID=UPI00286F0AAF|nr:MBL fold metallo-hydrolase [Pseudovibrio sp. M1P-2-3]